MPYLQLQIPQFIQQFFSVKPWNLYNDDIAVDRLIKTLSIVPHPQPLTQDRRGEPGTVL